MVKQRGMTLAEVTVAIGMLTSLTAIAVPTYRHIVLVSRERQLKADLKMIREAILRHEADTGLAPVSLQALTQITPPGQGWTSHLGTMRGWALVSFDNSRWRGPYLRRLPTDAVSGQPFVWNSNGHPTGVYSSNSAISTEGTPYNTW